MSVMDLAYPNPETIAGHTDVVWQEVVCTEKMNRKNMRLRFATASLM